MAKKTMPQTGLGPKGQLTMATDTIDQNYAADRKRERTRLYSPTEPFPTSWGVSRTHKEFADDADINRIMSLYTSKGIAPQVRPGEPWYGDFSTGTDYQTAVHRVMEADEAFDALPSKVRALCENEPSNLLTLLSTPEGVESLQEAGLKIFTESLEPPAAGAPKPSAEGASSPAATPAPEVKTPPDQSIS